MKKEDLEEIKKRKHTLSELCINIGEGQAVITKEDLIEFNECLPMSIPELEYVTREAKHYISFRNYRIADKLFDEFPEIPDIPHTHTHAQRQFDQLITEFPDHLKIRPGSHRVDAKRFDQLVSEFPDQDHDKYISKLADLIIDAKSSKSDVVLVSTWGIQCGIATYTKYLYDAIKNVDDKFPIRVHPVSEGVDGVVGRIVHFQHEFGIMPRIPTGRSKVIITFHSVPENIGSTIAAYEKNLNIVAYVAHFQEAYDIISASTKKDVWLIPHGSKIMSGNKPEIKEYFRKLIQIPMDEPCAFMFGFQSDNKNYTMVTQACEKAGVNHPRLKDGGMFREELGQQN